VELRCDLTLSDPASGHLGANRICDRRVDLHVGQVTRSAATCKI
jgi:hypothetical protein